MNDIQQSVAAYIYASGKVVVKQSGYWSGIGPRKEEPIRNLLILDFASRVRNCDSVVPNLRNIIAKEFIPGPELRTRAGWT